MKLYTIISQPLLETDEDMFPGLTSSVFDDMRKKDQNQPDPDDLEVVKRKDKILSDRLALYNKRYNDLWNQLDKHNALNVPSGLGMSAGPNEVMYTDFPWFDKYPALRYRLKNYAISKKSPWFNNIEDKVAQLEKFNTEVIKIFELRRGYVKKIKKILAEQKKSQRGSASDSFDQYAKKVPKLSPPSIMPTKIPVKNKRPINNPWVTANATKQYAGNVFHYPDWSPYWKDQIMQVEDMLNRNNKGGLGMMYASTHDNSGARFNFVITGANGNLTWRKYDPSPGAGQNWIFLNGQKMNTSRLLGMDKAKQDQAVKSL